VTGTYFLLLSPKYLISLDLIALTIFCEEYKL
jgi:hypothetical protein